MFFIPFLCNTHTRTHTYNYSVCMCAYAYVIVTQLYDVGKESAKLSRVRSVRFDASGTREKACCLMI